MHFLRERGDTTVHSMHTRAMLTDLFKFLLVIAAISFLIVIGTERLGYHWQWYRVPRYLVTFEGGRYAAGPLLKGLLVTFHITAVSFFGAYTIGLVTALFRVSGSIAARTLSRGYLEFFRNTPLLTQLFFIYFVVSPILGLSPFTSAVMGLSLFEGAYISEIIRAGIVSIHKGQWEAAYSVGLTTTQTFVHIILPQAFRRVLPPLTSQAISLVKDSSLVSVIAIYDLTMQGETIVSETFLTFEIWFTIAAIYLLISAMLSFLAHTLEARMRGKYA